MKRAAAATLTLALLLTALWLGRGRLTAGSSSAATPDQCIERMFAAGERGDVDAYLACFTGSQKAQVERELAAQSRASFAQGLMSAIAPLKGRAIVNQVASQLTAEVSVERIYAHRNDLQTYDLECQSGQWRIAAVRPVQALQPPIAFGTPVFAMPEDDTGAEK
ncbi:MAG TPA: hypothetical protein VHY20_08300 [Pirellulales bacterium]|jgi:hypothetical protein|nr:hypothetical protein [Pirellulales bacterium]